MAEFLTMQEAEDKFGKKGRTNAALTLGIIGAAQQKTQPIPDEINREVGSLSVDEQNVLAKHKNIKWLNKPMKQDLCHS